MSSSSPELFSQSLRDRLRGQAGAGRTAEAQRLSKIVAYSRLLDRLARTHPHGWAVKGGVAMDLRLGQAARFTKDLDLAASAGTDVDDILITAAEYDSGDFFRYEIERTRTIDGQRTVTTHRYAVQVFVGSRVWDRLVLDIGVGDIVPISPDRILLPPMLDFAGIAAPIVPVIPADQHVAEKLHAYTTGYGDAQVNSRVKDLIDLVLLGSHIPFAADRLRNPIELVFALRGTHDIPDVLPSPPEVWATAYADLARTVKLPDQLLEGYTFSRIFLAPVLSWSGGQPQTWTPPHYAWRQEP